MLIVSRADLDLEAVRRVAWAGEPVEIPSATLELIAKRRAEMLSFLEAHPDGHYYGATTLPGEGAKRLMSDEERTVFQRHVTAPPASFGDPLPDRVARAIVVARLANMIEGHSGARPELVQGVAGLLAGGPLPPVPSRGNPWEPTVASHLYGELVDRLGGLDVKEPMVLVHGCSAATGMIADQALAGRHRLHLAATVLALAAEAFLTPSEHFAVELEELWGDEHEAQALQRLRGLLTGGSDERRGFQGPTSYRMIPRVLGQLIRAQEGAETAASTALRSVTDNPVFLAPDDSHPNGQLGFHSGGFHSAQSIQALDGLGFAWAEMCQLFYLLGVGLMEDELALGAFPPWPRRAVFGPASTWAYDAAELARPSLLPLFGHGQTVSGSMSFAAWRKATSIGRCLDAIAATLAILASETFHATNRPVPPPLQPFLELTRSHRAPEGPWETTGRDTGTLADTFTAAVHSPGRPGW
jgi:histidine ammonia-lyase